MAKLTLTITLSSAAKEGFDDIKKQNGGVPNAERAEAIEAVVKDKLYITFTKKGEHQAQGLLSLASDDDKMMGESA